MNLPDLFVPGLDGGGCLTFARWHPPSVADFATPSAMMKLAHSPAVNASVWRRPSRKPSTRPKTMPSGRPLRKRKMALNGAGVRAKKKSAV